MTIIEKGSDGYYHPSTEAELQALVASAYQDGRKLRVRGASHSVRGRSTPTATTARVRRPRPTSR
jgi:FAD/FMN-containing dehydrogenase